MTAEEVAIKQKHIKTARALWNMTKVGPNDKEEGREHQIESAKAVYENFLKARNLTKEEVELNDERRFKIKFQEEFALMAGIICSVNPFAKISYDLDIMKVNLDSEDYAEVKCKFKHFKMLWRADLEMLKLAYYTKHATYFQPDEYAIKKHANMPGTNAYDKAKQEAAEKNKKLVGKAQVNMSNFKAHASSDAEKLMLYNLMRMEAILKHLADADYIKTR